LKAWGARNPLCFVSHSMRHSITGCHFNELFRFLLNFGATIFIIISDVVLNHPNTDQFVSVLERDGESRERERGCDKFSLFPNFELRTSLNSSLSKVVFFSTDSTRLNKICQISAFSLSCLADSFL